MESWNKEQVLYLDIYDIQCCFQEILNISHSIILKKSFLPKIQQSTIEKFFSNTQTQFVSDINEEYIHFKGLGFYYEGINSLNFPQFKNNTSDEYYYLHHHAIKSFIRSSSPHIHSLICEDIHFNQKLKLKISLMRLRYCSLINCDADDGYLFLPQTITHLEINSKVSPSVFINLLKHLKELKSLRIENCIWD